MIELARFLVSCHATSCNDPTGIFESLLQCVLGTGNIKTVQRSSFHPELTLVIMLTSFVRWDGCTRRIKWLHLHQTKNLCIPREVFTYATNPPQVYRSNNSRPLKNSTPSLLTSKRNSIIHDSIRYSFLDFTRPLQTTYLKPHYAFMRISSALTYSQMCTKMCTEYQNNAPESQKYFYCHNQSQQHSASNTKSNNEFLSLSVTVKRYL